MLSETSSQSRPGSGSGPPALAYGTPPRKVKSVVGTWDVTADYLGGAWLGGFLAIPVAAVFGWMPEVCALTALCWVFGLAPALVLAITLSIRSRIHRTLLLGVNAWLSTLGGVVWSAGVIGVVVAARTWRVPAMNGLFLVLLWTLIQPAASSFLLARRTQD